jgi:hypothetical protein
MVRSESLGSIAQRFGLSKAAVLRHKTNHLSEDLLAAKEARDLAKRVETATAAEMKECREKGRAGDVLRELERCFQKANRLIDACDQWLRDPDDPTRYDIGPRADDVTVVYDEHDEEGRPTRRKRRLSKILADIEERSPRICEFKRLESKHADPRHLILKALGEVRMQIELQVNLFAILHGVEQVAEYQRIVLEEIQNAAPEVQERIVERLNSQYALRAALSLS